MSTRSYARLFPHLINNNSLLFCKFKFKFRLWTSIKSTDIWPPSAYQYLNQFYNQFERIEFAGIKDKAESRAAEAQGTKEATFHPTLKILSDADPGLHQTHLLSWQSLIDAIRDLMATHVVGTESKEWVTTGKTQKSYQNHSKVTHEFAI